MSQLFSALQTHWSLKRLGRFPESCPSWFRWLSTFSLSPSAHIPRSSLHSSNLQKLLRALPKHVRVVPLCEFSPSCGEGFCSEYLVLTPVLHGSSPAIPASEPGSAAEAAAVVKRLQPKRLFVQLSPERLQQIGGHVWMSLKGSGTGPAMWLGPKDFWNRWSVYPRIHGGPLSFEIQLAIAAAMELRGGEGVECNIIPMDRQVSVGVRRLHEKCLYSAGDSEYNGYMKYATEAIRFWYEQSALSSLPALQHRFHRSAPLAYATLVEEKAMYMAGQILRGSDGGSAVSSANIDRPLDDGSEGSGDVSGGGGLSDVSVVVCGAMEIGEVEGQLLKLLRQREQFLRSSDCSQTLPFRSDSCRTPTTHGGKKVGSRKGSDSCLWPSGVHDGHKEDEWDEKFLRVLPIEFESLYFQDPCRSPPVTQVPLLIFRYFLIPIAFYIVGIWVVIRLLRWISRGVFFTTNPINERHKEADPTAPLKPNPHRGIL
eukprot:GHVS01065815.1.p1 GENE.GHVS01065815.1~~GHVS01065815.1.p1  ORF type:complete len:484 (-),score=37.90 GHVS01065815.1:113-1564(-)